MTSQETPTDRVDVVLLARDVDTARQEARLRLYVSPAGSLATPDGRFAEPILIDSSSESDKGILTAAKGSSTLISEFLLSFEEGEDVTYPFDRYRSPLWITASRVAADGEPDERLPVRVVFEAADSSYRYSVADESH